MNRRTAEAVQYVGVALVAGSLALWSLVVAGVVLGVALIVLAQVSALRGATDGEVG